MYRVLVCDDDSAILESVKIYLENNGYEVVAATDGVDALEKADKLEIHCCVMDIMMPRLDGLRATIKLREKYNFPIIFLSAKGEDTDKITGLNFGADDYVTKPFNPLELVARVGSQIRRYATLGNLIKTENTYITGGLVLNTETKEVSVDGDFVSLTAREYGILEYLMKNMGKVLSSAQIYEAVWNEVAFRTEKTVTVHIKNIREKIEINPKEPKYLKVVWGLGYKIEKI